MIKQDFVKAKHNINNKFKCGGITLEQLAGVVENIIFENSGKELKHPLENYFEPFFSNEDKQKDSFGLGLYIIHNILKANNYTLEYEYTDGTNRFICKKDESSTI